MANHDPLHNKQITNGLTPVADAFAGGVATDLHSLENYRKITWIIFTGAFEDTGVSNIVTVDASDDASASSTTAMAFNHRSMAWNATTEAAWGALTAATSSGYNFTTNNTASNAIFAITVTADKVEAAQAGAKFARLAIAETANKTITAGVLVIMEDPRYAGDVPPSVQS